MKTPALIGMTAVLILLPTISPSANELPPSELARQHLDRGELQAAVAILDQLIANDPENVGCLYMRGVCYCRMENDSRALPDFESVIRVRPDFGAAYSYRAQIRFRAGEVKLAMEDFTTELRLDERAAGVEFRLDGTKPLTPDDKQHGAAEVASMIKDRQLLNAHGESARWLIEWTERQFAGESLGFRIDWNASAPKVSVAAHYGPRDGNNAQIMSRMTHLNGEPIQFEERWRGVIYECFNLRNTKSFEELQTLALKGELTKQEYVTQSVALENQAKRLVRKFYVTRFLPWAIETGVKTTPGKWFCGDSTTASTIVQRTTDPSKYPWNSFGRRFDWIQVQRLSVSGEYASAIPILHRMALGSVDETQASQSWNWYVNMCIRSGKHDDAMSGVMRGLRRCPDSVPLLVQRAYLNSTFFDESAKAKIDLQRILKLEPNHAYAKMLLARLSNSARNKTD